MTDEEKKLLKHFEARLCQLLMEFAEQKKKNRELQQRIREKDRYIEVQRNEYKKLQSSYVRLKTAKVISIGDDEAKDTRQRISKLVREVDKCIALLNSK